ncbi:putative peptidoglycan lipid II flippase [Keratinibaculum paraultunense]|uniref:Probable lipid II flippase MurJ n=1 Tax=Keratinibaculum paraultunense TaxID=1278232 RepID=A0A4R3L0Z5_9FIRM|nr:murein biosynthesis integral membrane protein MurJ [Keratinibaculum paraultunense]QQY79968.1 murein biosynthesis integral membrane protein MurJ [Keratinibaculum paraultunense]TCS91711.1 putative peptidoglycan lipid II flippase [Keratinibaculum paraultunense]
MTSTRKVVQSAAMIAIFTLISKFLGFLREVLIASTYGSGYETDTYFVAMTATVIIMTTIGSSLNTTLIPIFTEIEEKSGKEAKLKFLNNVLNMVFFITIILALLGFFLSPLVIKVLAKGFTGEQFTLAVKLNRIGLPIIVFLGFTYVFSGYLHSSEIFGPPAIMGLPYNLVYIIFLLFFAEEGNIQGLMLTSVIAASTQFLIQVPAIKHQGYRYSCDIDLKDPYLKKTLILILPVMLGSAVQQINTIIDKTLASSLVEGSISALTYASRISDIIISVFVMAITTVIFPMLSRAFSQEDNMQIKKIMGQGINIILIVTIPATIGIFILAKPMVRIFFQRGAFDKVATYMTSQALIFYSVGLVGSSLRLMLNRVYYSFQDTKTPMLNGVLAVGLNIVLNLILIKPMGHSGLALATSISATFTTLLLFIDLKKKLGRIGLKRYLSCFIKTLIASIIMGIVVYFMYFGLVSLLPNKWIVDLLILLLSVVVGVFLYVIVCSALRIREMRILLRALIKKMR